MRDAMMTAARKSEARGQRRGTIVQASRGQMHAPGEEVCELSTSREQVGESRVGTHGPRRHAWAAAIFEAARRMLEVAKATSV